MARIIEEEKDINCSHCRTKIAYTSKDIRTTFFTKDPYIECPACGNKIFIL